MPDGAGAALISLDAVLDAVSAPPPVTAAVFVTIDPGVSGTSTGTVTTIS
jgi:hypothetical protein